MPGYSHQGTIELVDPNNVSTTYEFKANFIDSGSGIELSCTYNSGPIGFVLSYNLDNRNNPADITLLTQVIEFQDGSIGDFLGNAPQTHYCHLRSKLLVAESYIVDIDGVQHSMKVIARSLQEDIDGVEVSEDAPLEQTRVSPVKLRTNQLTNGFDRLADLRGIKRFDIGENKESNFELLGRVEDSIQAISNSTAAGIVNGASRQLGLDVGASAPKAITVRLRESVTWRDSQDVMLKLSNGRLRIYSKWVVDNETKLVTSSVEEVQIPGSQDIIRMDILLKDFTIGRLIDLINLSAYYECGNEWEIYGRDFLDRPAYGLAPTSSRELAYVTLPAENIVDLPHEYLMDRSLLSKTAGVLENEYPPTGSTLDSGLAIKGDFWVDYENGFIATKRSAGIILDLLYTVNKRKIDIVFRGVEIAALSSEEMQDSLFNQNENSFYTTHEERFTNGMPKNHFFKVLGQILSSGESSQFWGK